MIIIYLIHEFHLNNYSNRHDSNRRDLSDSSQCWCDSKVTRFKITQFLRPTFSNLKLFSHSAFLKFCCLQGFHFHFFCDMPQHSPVGEIWCPYIKYAEAPDVSWWYSITTITPESNSSTTIQTGNMWAYDSNFSRWVHTDAVICVTPKVNTNFAKNILTPKGDPPISVSLYINGSAHLVIMNERVFQTRSTYRDLFRTYSYIRQRYMFHTSAVGVWQLIRCWLLISIFTKRIGQWWCW